VPDDRQLREQDSYPAEPSRVLDALTDPAFLQAWAAALGARVDDVAASGADGSRRTRLRLGVPTRGIPPAFARFVGTEVTVEDERTWRSDGDGGFAADVEVRARIFGRVALVRGRRTLTAEGGGTLSVTTAEVTVDAPVVGRQAEGAVGQLVGVVLRREAEVLRERLGRPGMLAG
jgi:hypothetical protein